MIDEGTAARMVATEKINREGVPADYDGPVWDTEQLAQEFDVVGFTSPCVVVKRKSDGAKGTLYFVHSPRLYFDWQDA